MGILSSDGSRVAELDLTGVDNASTSYPLKAVVMEQCDLGHWHERGRTDVPVWGSY